MREFLINLLKNHSPKIKISRTACQFPPLGFSLLLLNLIGMISNLVVLIRAWARAPKNKKIQPEKNSLYFRKWNFLPLISKKNLIFSQKEAFLIFREMKKFFIALILKRFLYFLKRNIFLHFLKRKLFLYFRKWNSALFNPSSKNKNIRPKEISYTSGNGSH